MTIGVLLSTGGPQEPDDPNISLMPARTCTPKESWVNGTRNSRSIIATDLALRLADYVCREARYVGERQSYFKWQRIGDKIFQTGGYSKPIFCSTKEMIDSVEKLSYNFP